MSPNPARLRAAGIAVSKSGGGFDVELPRSLKAERRGEIAILFLARPQKRNAIDDPTVAGIEAFFAALPDAIKAVVLAGEGEHFCAGLDLAELTSRDIAQGIAHSRSWHRAFERIEFGKAPVVAVLHGAVVGGGLELAAGYLTEALISAIAQGDAEAKARLKAFLEKRTAKTVRS